MIQSLHHGMSPQPSYGGLSPIAKPGNGFLEIQSVGGQSTVTSTWARSPLRILTPRFRGQSVWAYLSSFGGGMVAGDEMSLTLNLGKGTRCFLTTQSSTKVYSNPTQRPCSQILNATLASGSCLILAPDAVQAFADSTYSQSQQFHLEPDSGLVLVDWLCSGRLARGERWAFSRFESRIEVFLNSERILLDSLLLDPSHGRLDSQHRLGRFNSLAVILILGEPLREAALRALERARRYPVASRSPLLCSVSPVRGGALIRLAGERVEEMTRQIQLWLDFVPALLGDDPWARKW
jgi:urease accessory protein